MDGEMATDITKPSEDYNNHKKPYNNNRRKSKPKNIRGNYDSNTPRNNAYNVVVITTGPNGGTTAVEPEEECLDDNASICSSQSSGASEHSVGANKQTKKMRRTRCDIHSKKNKKDASLLEEPETNDSIVIDDKAGPNGEKQSNPVCTCSKNRTKSRRPEPEGGSIMGKSMTGSVVMSELDQILCSNEPLFSDMENDKEQSEEREFDRTNQKTSRNMGRRQGPNVDDAKQESDRLRSRMVPNMDGAFCVQMLSTNTSIKFAILQTELKNIKDRSLKRVEADIRSISTKFSSMQELMDDCIKTISSFTQQLQQTSKFVNDQIDKENREERELTSSHIDMDLVNISLKHDFSSCDLDIANDRMSHLERTVTRLESEMKSLGSTNANEMTNLKARHKEVLTDINTTERSIIHISSCLHFR